MIQDGLGPLMVCSGTQVIGAWNLLSITTSTTLFQETITRRVRCCAWWMYVYCCWLPNILLSVPMSKLILFTKNSAKYDDLNGAFSVYYYGINAMANDTPNLWHFYSAHNSSSSIVFLTMCIWSLSKECSRGYGEWHNSGLWRWYIGTYVLGSALQFFHNSCSWQGLQPTSTQNMLRGPWKCVWATRYTQVHNNKPLILWCLARFMCKVGS